MIMQVIGEITLEQGDRTEAKRILRETLQQSKENLGQDHPNTMNSLRYLAKISREDGDLVEAQKLDEEVLVIERRVLGENHENTLGIKQ